MAPEYESFKLDIFKTAQTYILNDSTELNMKALHCTQHGILKLQTEWLDCTAHFMAELYGTEIALRLLRF